MKRIIVAAALLMALPARAEVIKFDEEELASESVLPIFDNPESVKSRLITTKRKLEIGGMATYNLTEPFFNQYSLSGTSTFHLDETHGVNIFGTYFLPGTQSYVDDLNPPPGTTENLNLQYAPRPKWLVLGSYQYTGFYGKLSLTKDYVMNLGLYGLAGVGMIMIGDKSFPLLSAGLGQKFYFSKQLALRFDLRALFYQGPNPLTGSKTTLLNARTEQSASAFEKRLYMGSLLSVGMIWLIPNF